MLRHLILLTLSTTLAWAQDPAPPKPAPEKPEPVKLEVVVKEGDASLIDERHSMRFDDSESGIPMIRGWRKRYHQRVLAVADGRIQTAERRYTLHAMEMSNGASTQRHVHMLHGNTVKLTMDKQGSTIPADPKATIQPPKQGAKRRALNVADTHEEWLRDPWSELLPKEALAVGKEFTITEDQARLALGVPAEGLESAKGSGRLAEIRELKGGVRVAKLDIALEAKRVDKERGTTLIVEMQGSVLVDLTHKRIFQVDMKGDLVMRSAEEEREGRVVYKRTQTAPMSGRKDPDNQGK